VIWEDVVMEGNMARCVYFVGNRVKTTICILSR